MDIVSKLAFGFGVACTPANLWLALIGSLLGLLAGLLPRVRPMLCLALLLAATQGLAALSVLILLACVVMGARHGALAATLLADPAAASASGVMGVQADPLARPGRGATALAAAAVGSCLAACAVMLGWAAFTPTLGPLALAFGPAESGALMLLALMGAVVLASGTLLKALAMALLGLLLGLLGPQAQSGLVRFDFGLPELRDGLGFVALAVGLLAYGQTIDQLAHNTPLGRPVKVKVRDVRWPGRADFKATAAVVWRGAAQTALLPLMILGLPLNALLVLLLGAMGLHQMQPGPQAMADNPDLFWGLLAAIGVGHVLLAALLLPLLAVWTRLQVLPYRWLAVAIVLLGAIGIYSLRHSALDVWLLAALGALGYLFKQLDLDGVPLLLGFVLGPRLEEQLHQALALSNGDWTVFVARPLSAGLLLPALLMFLVVLLPARQQRLNQVWAPD